MRRSRWLEPTESLGHRLNGGVSVMGDALFVGITVGFFVLTWALIRLCERL